MWLWAASEAQDPIWLRTLATVLPVLGTMVAAIVAGPLLVEKFKQRNDPPPNPAPSETPPPGQGLPAPMAMEAVDRAQADPLLSLLINDLHTRLSDAHAEAADLHAGNAANMAMIARLEAELQDKDERVSELERELRDSATQRSYLRQKATALTNEVESLRRQLAVCVEGYNQ